MMRNFAALTEYVSLLIIFGLYVTLGLKVAEILYIENGPDFFDILLEKGWLLTLIMYSLTVPIYLAVPISVSNLSGIFFFNPFSNRKFITGAQVSKEIPFLCFRVVTKGLYSKLVQEVTDSNVKVVLSLGIQNFVFEVVTDNPLNLKTSNYVREIVVPRDYTTPNRTLFKARALHYCLNPTINILSNEDWIVHLDEETRVTESVIHGILDFVTKPGSHIGQGAITYGQTDIENVVTTLMDGIRTAFDFGMFRVAFQAFHRPVFGFKGSFIVVKMAVEADIGFDFGPKESIAEDLRFALTAWHKGYKFDFVEGVMQEKSTFTILDYIKQRKRWFIGHFHIIWGNSLPLYCKFALMPMHVANLLLWMNLTTIFFPVPLAKWQLQLFVLLSCNILFMLVFGNYMSLGRRRAFYTKFGLCLSAQLVMPLIGVLEAYSALAGLYNRNKLTFDIVQKETRKGTVSDTERETSLVDV